MGMATTPAVTALQLSEAASRSGSPERASFKSLLDLLAQAPGSEVSLSVGDVGTVALPGLVVDLLRQVGSVLGRGDGVMVSQVARELTTGEAARMLGISRPTLTALLDRGEIKSHKVGTHRRVALQDVLVYRRRLIDRQRAVYEKMMAEQDDLGIYE